VRLVGAHLGEGPFWYTLFGERVRSDFRLPLPPEQAPVEQEVGYIFRRPESETAPPPVGPKIAEQNCSHGTPITIVHRSDDEAWVWRRLIGTFHIHSNYRLVDVYPVEGGNEHFLGLMLAGQLAVFIMQLRGAPSLHASAVVPDNGAVVFLGQNGQGKSTMAASFLHRGARLLSDDALVLLRRPDGLYGVPGPRLMKLWPEAARQTLQLSDELPDLLDIVKKKLLTVDGQYPLAEAPERIRAVYVLERYDPQAEGRTECTIRLLSGRESLAALLAQVASGNFLRPGEATGLLATYTRLAAQAPVRHVSYPNGFEYQAAVHARILQDLNLK
jgi:hypothetical protein